MTITFHDSFLKELEDEIALMLRRFGYDNVATIHIGTYYPEMTLLKATLDPSIVKVQDILKEFPHPQACFMNLDLLARYLLKNGHEDENSLHEELELITAHGINGHYLHRQWLLEKNAEIKQHVSCHPRVMKIPFSTKRPIPVLLDDFETLSEIEQRISKQDVSIIDGFTKCLASWITPSPELASLLLNDALPDQYLVTWNVLPELHHIWGLGCEWGFFPLRKGELDVHHSNYDSFPRFQSNPRLKINWLQAWDDVFIFIDENRMLAQYLTKPGFITWFLRTLTTHVPELTRRSLQQHVLVFSTPQSWLLIPKKDMLNDGHAEAMIRRINQLLVRNHVITEIESFESITSVRFCLDQKMNVASKEKPFVTIPIDLIFNRIVLFLNEVVTQNDTFSSRSVDCSEIPEDFMEKNARSFWKRPLPITSRDAITEIGVTNSLHEIDSTWKLPYPFTSIIGEIIIKCDVHFQPFARITHAPFYAELMIAELEISTKSLLHFKHWVKELKKQICSRFLLEEDEILVLPTSIRVSKLVDTSSLELSAFERTLFRHAITDIQVARKALENLRIEWIQ